MIDQRAQLGRPRVHGRLRGRQLADLANCVEGQANLLDAVERTISLETPEKTYRLNDETATLVVRPRGWHLLERHLAVDGAPVSASLFDFGLAPFHLARRQLERGSGPYFYLPKLESHLEARLWAASSATRRRRSASRAARSAATVLIEHDPGGVRDGRDPLGAPRALGAG